MRIQLRPLFSRCMSRRDTEMGQNVRRILLGTAVAVSLCVTLVGYCQDGSIPLLELATTLYFQPSVARISPPLAPSPSTPGCNCTLQRNSSSDFTTAKFVSQETAAEKLLPLSQLKSKIDFSRHPGLSLLDHQAMNRYYLCAPNEPASLTEENSNTTECKRRTFLSHKLPVVALASPPGSGNTWLRYLLEQASGVFTGSIYCDHSLKTIFPGEHIVGGSVLVVKTHSCESRELPEDQQEAGRGRKRRRREYDRAVVLVRNPFDALVSEANRRWNSRRNTDHHVGLANEIAFIGNAHWDWYVETKSNNWAYLLHTWVGHTPLPTHLVQYEKLVDNTAEELTKVLTFLGVAVDNQTLECAISKSNHGSFTRRKHLNFDPFSTENKAVVNHVLKMTAPTLSKYGISYSQR